MREVVQFILETSRILTDRASRNPRRTHDLGAGDPAVVIDGVVAHHLKVLRVVLRGCVRVGLVEGVHEAGTFDRLLRDAVHHVRRRYAGCFQDGRYDVDHVGELVTDAALGHAIAIPWRTPPKCEAICLVQEKGVSNAQDHATAMWGYVMFVPHTS